MYDPSIGRWLEMDPLGFEAGDANLYRYVGNGPTNWTDPSGLHHSPILDAFEKEKPPRKPGDPLTPAEKAQVAAEIKRLNRVLLAVAKRITDNRTKFENSRTLRTGLLVLRVPGILANPFAGLLGTAFEQDDASDYENGLERVIAWDEKLEKEIIGDIVLLERYLK